MDPIDTLAKPGIVEHLPTFLIIASVMVTSLVIVIKKLTDAYAAGKKFVQHAVDEKVPESVGVVMEAKAPAIFDKVIRERLDRHEEVEDSKLREALREVRNDIEANTVSRDKKLSEGFQSILDKLTSVDSRLQVVQIRLESHEARLHAVEQVVHPMRREAEAKKPRNRKR